MYLTIKKEKIKALRFNPMTQGIYMDKLKSLIYKAKTFHFENKIDRHMIVNFENTYFFTITQT